MKQTTINLPSGKTVAGYIGDNGKTYKDPQGTQRIDYGTIVNTNGGTYKYTENGSVKVPDGTTNKPATTQGPSTATVYDSNGNASTGYIIGGQTYADAQGTTRVANGSVVNTGGGTYYKSADNNSAKLTNATGNDETFSYGGNLYKVYRGANGQAYVDAECTTPVPNGAAISGNGVNTVNSAYGEISNGAGVLNNISSGYDRSRSSLSAATDAQAKIVDEDVNRALRRIDAQKNEANKRQVQANADAQQMYLNASNPYGINAEQLASLGLSQSGFAESSVVSMMNSYQKAIQGNASDRANALLELELAAEEAISEGNSRKYQLYAEMYKTIAELDSEETKLMTDAGINFLQMDQDERWKQKNYDLDKWQTEQSIAQQVLDREENARQHDTTLAQNDDHFNRNLEQDNDHFYAGLNQEDEHFNKQLAQNAYQFNKSNGLSYAKFYADQRNDEVAQILSYLDSGITTERLEEMPGNSVGLANALVALLLGK